MPNYEIVYANILTGVIGGQVPVYDFSFEAVLSAPGSAKFSMPLDTGSSISYSTGDGELTVPVPALTLTDLAPWRTAVYVERDNVCVWSGIISTIDVDVANDSATIGCVGWHEYWRKRYLRSSLSYQNTDQAVIARALIDYAQSVPIVNGLSGDIGIDTSETKLTGILRDRTWYGYDRENIGELLESLSNTENGFDFFYTSARTTYGYVTSYNTLYPRSGRETNIVFRLDVNVDLFSASIDGDPIATKVEAVGAGEGSAKPSSLATSTATSSDESYPLLEVQQSFSNVTFSSTLSAYANLRLTQGSKPVIIPTLTVRPTGDPDFGSYRVGDSVAVEGSYGLLDLNEQYRITTINVSVDANGAETVKLTVIPLEIFG